MNISTRRSASLFARFAAALLLLALSGAGCEPPDPNANTPTSGKLIVYVDEAYAPAVRVLADTFMHRSPNAKLEIRAVTARAAVQALLTADVRDTSGADTAATTAVVIGRKLIGDEQAAVTKGGFDVKEYVIGYDGIAIVVPNGSPLKSTRLEHLRRGLLSPQGGALLDSIPSPASAPIRFLLPDQNSSLLPVIRFRG